MDPLTIIGWREWATLPELGLSRIKVKVDTGARTSALHAFDISRFQQNQQDWLQFNTQPVQYSDKPITRCIARLKDIRTVTNSGGQKEQRFVIETDLVLGDQHWPVELTLTDRRDMKFRMLLGRHALRGKMAIDPSQSFLTSVHKRL